MYGLTYRLSSLSNTTSANIPRHSPAPIPCPCIAAITGTAHLKPTSKTFVSVNFASRSAFASNFLLANPLLHYSSRLLFPLSQQSSRQLRPVPCDLYRSL